MDTVFEINKPAKITSVADYVEGKVTGESIFKTLQGSVTLVAVTKGTEIKEHTADTDIMVQVIEGEIIFNVNGNANKMEAGDFILVKKLTPHSVNAVTNAKFTISKIKE
ncbi:MAG: cupin domain-containing protein [Muribaculaceae bacterium]|nr:cupin domain-containing protein [Muribaculaceae bacterium]